MRVHLSLGDGREGQCSVLVLCFESGCQHNAQVDLELFLKPKLASNS
jgi:hypothetical protein